MNFMSMPTCEICTEDSHVVLTELLYHPRILQLIVVCEVTHKEAYCLCVEWTYTGISLPILLLLMKNYQRHVIVNAIQVLKLSKLSE